MTMTVDAAIGREEAGTTPLPDGPMEPERFSLEELLKFVGDARDPRIGKQASDMLKRCYEKAAADVEGIGKETVDRALAFQQEAVTFATVLREAGENFCRQAEVEARRTYRISTILAEVNRHLGSQAHAELTTPETP